jgi:hypothetical protein
MVLSSKRVHTESQEYYTISVPLDASAEEIADAEEELSVFLRAYYYDGDMYRSDAPEIFQVEEQGKIVLKFPAVYCSTGTDRNPLVYDDIVDARSLMRKK